MPPSQNKREDKEDLGNPTTNVNRCSNHELQLRAEERWLVAAITRIKNQQNALQIERLHLDNLLRQRINQQNNGANADENISQGNDSNVANVQQPMSSENAVASSAQLQSDVALDEGDICNLQELDLSVNNNFSYIPDYGSNAAEEDDEDDSDLIDLNFLICK